MNHQNAWNITGTSWKQKQSDENRTEVGSIIKKHIIIWKTEWLWLVYAVCVRVSVLVCVCVCKWTSKYMDDWKCLLFVCLFDFFCFVQILLPAVTPRTCTRFGSSGGVNVGAGWWSSERLHNSFILTYSCWKRTNGWLNGLVCVLFLFVIR